MLGGEKFRPCIRPTEPAASTSIAHSHRFPCPVPTGVRRPADSCIAGASPAHDARWPAVGNRDKSPPVSAMITCATFSPDPWNGMQQLDLARPGPARLDQKLVKFSQRLLHQLEPAQDRTGLFVRPSGHRRSWWPQQAAPAPSADHRRHGLGPIQHCCCLFEPGCALVGQGSRFVFGVAGLQCRLLCQM